MMKVSGFYQQYDFSAEEFDEISLEEAISKYQNINWDTQLKKFEETSSECPPNLSLQNNYDDKKVGDHAAVHALRRRQRFRSLLLPNGKIISRPLQIPQRSFTLH